MILGILVVGGLFLVTCVWMAASEGEPGWGWTALKYAVTVPLLIGAMFAVVWAWEGLSKT